MNDVDDLIERATAILAKREHCPLPFAELHDRLSGIVPSFVQPVALEELTTLCFYCEDLIHRRPDVTSQTICSDVLRVLRPRVAAYGLAVDFLHKQSDQVLTTEDCMTLVRECHNALLSVESNPIFSPDQTPDP